MLNQIPAALFIEAARDQLLKDQQERPDEEARELLKCAHELHCANFHPSTIAEAYHFGLRVAAMLNDLGGPEAALRTERNSRVP